MAAALESAPAVIDLEALNLLEALLASVRAGQIGLRDLMIRRESAREPSPTIPFSGVFCPLPPIAASRRD
jgi:hypothetical protein